MAGQVEKYNNNKNYYFLTPYNSSQIRGMDVNGNSYNYSVTNVFGIRPSLNLKSNVVITGGDGTKEKPFQIELAS